MTREGEDSVTIEEGAAGYLYSLHPPNLETRPTGQGDHVQGSCDLHGTGSRDLRAMQATRCESLQSSHCELCEPSGAKARRARKPFSI